MSAIVHSPLRRLDLGMPVGGATGLQYMSQMPLRRRMLTDQAPNWHDFMMRNGIT